MKCTDWKAMAAKLIANDTNMKNSNLYADQDG